MGPCVCRKQSVVFVPLAVAPCLFSASRPKFPAEVEETSTSVVLGGSGSPVSVHSKVVCHRVLPPAVASGRGEPGCLQRAHWSSLEYVLALHRALGFGLPRSPANLLPPPQLFFQTAAIIECPEVAGHGSVPEPRLPSVPWRAFGGGKRRSEGGRLLSPFKKQEHGMCIRLSSPESISAFRFSQPSLDARTPRTPPRAFLHKPLLFAALSQYTGSNSSPDVPYQTQSHANKLWHT